MQEFLRTPECAAVAFAAVLATFALVLGWSLLKAVSDADDALGIDERD